MGNIVLGRQVVSTGPCTNPTQNFQEIARVLEAMGNPSYDPGDGPIAIIDGVPAVVEYDVVNPLYYKDGDVVREDENGVLQPVIIGEEGGVGTLSSTVRYYLKVKGTAQTAVDGWANNKTFDIKVTETLETLRVHVPYVEGTPPVVPDIAVGSIINVVNLPSLKVKINGEVTVRYHHTDSTWHPDSLDNWEEHARGRDTWDQTVTQALGHTGTDYSIDWLSPTILVKVSDLASFGSKNVFEVRWNGASWYDMTEDAVTVHNRSNTAIEEEVEMTAVLVGDQYVLSWPDMYATPGSVLGSDQIMYREAGDKSMTLGGEECD